MAEYTLPELPYDYGALDPHISGKIMELHHTKHHQTYVNGLNTALEKLEEARSTGSFETVNLLEKNLSFNLGGHINHSIFWKNLSPEGGDKPTGELAAAIDDNFGSFDAYRAQFEATALGIQGSGWAITAWDTLGQRLVIVQLYDQQNNIPATLIPISQLDMWEHAFYLDYMNVKADYVKAFWNIANWADAQERFTAATSGGQVLF
ncbi:superoxide dismutase [Aeromicrobium phragmitis]|uniref:Superoxide dismutase n=1 Tax=Aeromicrobium phragmitis TaxID=2478914 RepID=A0A3L8PLD8_9ACTN|nr:superoxide dismutase [Aeromicrobium phragmitis]RLV55543.1 superoxide dismutase [Aeromicrobium phragmitis]